ncbi:alpha/beta hydrolase [Novosphingobium sp. ST904]|uniref:alpha/beta hydrolase n=1 Tax=Novosphingobium sp. ST904 TaxID=1684385 RepID=UPI0021019C6E|nr:alpha/beta hydrolase [Novosphingobium sp. ST904]
MAKTNQHAAPAQEPLVLLIPGLDGSGPGHWQRRWAEEMDNAQMVDLGLWEKPHRNTWINRLNLSVQRARAWCCGAQPRLPVDGVVGEIRTARLVFASWARCWWPRRKWTSSRATTA